jgi:hypothetical protein
MNNKILILLFVSILVLTGCKKTTPPKAIITVIYSNKKPVEGALVKIYSKPAGSTISMEKTTDASGKAEFETDQEYVLSLKVTKEVDGNVLSATGTVVFKYNEVFEKTVMLN